MSVDAPTYHILWIWKVGLDEDRLYEQYIRTDGGRDGSYQPVETVIDSQVERGPESGANFVFTQFNDRVPGPEDPTIVHRFYRWLAEVTDQVETVQSFDPEELIEGDLPEIFGELLEGWREEIGDITDQLRRVPIRTALQDQASKLIAIISRVRSTSTGLRTLQEHARGEFHHRRRVFSLTNERDEPEYSGPLYVYAKDYRFPSRKATYVRRSAPINLVCVKWPYLPRIRTPGNLKRALTEVGWSSPHLLSFKRYVIVLEEFSLPLAPTLEPPGAEADKRDYSPQGYHARIYSAESMDKHRPTIAQIHYDTFSHGMIRSDWRFAHSRRVCCRDMASSERGRAFGVFHAENVYRNEQDLRADFTSSGGAIAQYPCWKLDRSLPEA